MILTAILASLVPGALSTVVLALAFRAWRTDVPVDRARWALPVALTVAWSFGYVVLRGWPALPPVVANEWLFFLALGATAVAVAGAAWSAPSSLRWKAVRWAARWALSALVPWLLLQPMVAHTWTGSERWLWLGAVALAVFAVWSALESLARRVPGPSLPIALLLAVSGTAGALVVSGSALLGQLSGALAAGLGGVVLLTLRRPDVTLERSVMPVVATLHVGLVCLGYFYAELPAAAAVLLLAAPLAPWVAQVGPLRRLGSWSGAAVRALLVAAVLASALWIAFHPPETPPPADSDKDAPTHQYENDYSNLGG